MSSNNNEYGKNLVETIQKITSKIDVLRKEDVSEEITKSNLVLPMFGGLEYNIYDFKEIEPERRTKGGDVVDYVLKIPYKDDYRMIFYCEVKRVGNPLTDLKAIKQCVGYATSDGIPFGIVTNGSRYILIDPTDPRELKHKIILIIDLPTKKNVKFLPLLHSGNWRQAASSCKLNGYINMIKSLKIFNKDDSTTEIQNMIIEWAIKKYKKVHVDISEKQVKELICKNGIENLMLNFRNNIIPHNSVICANLQNKTLRDEITVPTFKGEVNDNNNVRTRYSLNEFIGRVENLFDSHVDLIKELIRALIPIAEGATVIPHKCISIYTPTIYTPTPKTRVWLYVYVLDAFLRPVFFTNGEPSELDFDNNVKFEPKIHPRLNGRLRHYGDKHGFVILENVSDIEANIKNFTRSLELIIQAVKNNERTGWWGPYVTESCDSNEIRVFDEDTKEVKEEIQPFF